MGAALDGFYGDVVAAQQHLSDLIREDHEATRLATAIVEWRIASKGKSAAKLKSEFKKRWFDRNLPEQFDGDKKAALAYWNKFHARAPIPTPADALEPTPAHGGDIPPKVTTDDVIRVSLARGVWPEELPQEDDSPRASFVPQTRVERQRGVIEPRYGDPRYLAMFREAVAETGATPQAAVIAPLLDELLDAWEHYLKAAVKASRRGEQQIDDASWIRLNNALTGKLYRYVNLPDANKLPARSEESKNGNSGEAPTASRNAKWKEWNREGLTPAKIRDKWNALTDEERKAISAKKWQKIHFDEKGTDVVKKALNGMK